MYEIYCKLKNKYGVTDYKVSKETGISRSTFSDWKSGRSEPKKEKLQKIADYFGVTLRYLMTGSSGNSVTEKELFIILAYRNASESIQEAVRKLLDIEEKGNDERQPDICSGLSSDETMEMLKAKVNAKRKTRNKEAV